MHFLVTGGAGFIGSHLVDSLLLKGHQVTIIDSLVSGKKENINKKAKFVYGDILDFDLLCSLFKNIDCCYHLAAIPSVQTSIDKWIESHRVNLEGSINIFEIASKKGIPVVYASSAAIYGSPKSLPLKEIDIPIPLSPYGFDKYSNEVQAKFFAEFKGLRSVGLRFFNVYGTRQDPLSPYTGVISVFIEKITNNKPIEVYGDGTQERDFICINDVVDSLIKANDVILLNKAEIFNICTGIGTSINNLISILFKIINNKVEIRYLPARNSDIYKSIGDPDKAYKSLHFKALTSIEKGLKTII